VVAERRSTTVSYRPRAALSGPRGRVTVDGCGLDRPGYSCRRRVAGSERELCVPAAGRTSGIPPREQRGAARHIVARVARVSRRCKETTSEINCETPERRRNPIRGQRIRLSRQHLPKHQPKPRPSRWRPGLMRSRDFTGARRVHGGNDIVPYSPTSHIAYDATPDRELAVADPRRRQHRIAILSVPSISRAFRAQFPVESVQIGSLSRETSCRTAECVSPRIAVGSAGLAHACPSITPAPLTLGRTASGPARLDLTVVAQQQVGTRRPTISSVHPQSIFHVS
jgi:hypothetical protein